MFFLLNQRIHSKSCIGIAFSFCRMKKFLLILQILFRLETKKFVLGFVFLISSVSHSQTVIEVTHPETGETFEVTIEKPSQSTLNQWRPSQLNFQKIKNLTQTTACQIGQVCKAAVNEFPLSAAAFYGASFLVSARQMLISPQNDPVAFHNFLIQNITDPVSHISFLSFIAANRGAGQVLESLAVSRGWIRNHAQFESMLEFLQSRSESLRGFNLANLNNATPAQIQNYMRLRQELDMKWPTPAKSPTFDAARMSVGLAAGFVVSGIVAEFLHDEHVAHCFLTPKYTIERIQKETARMGMTPARACDVAWDRWVSTDKILDYMPDIASAIVTSAILAKALPWMHKKATKATIALRGIRFFRGIGTFIPQSRVILMVEHAYFFLEMHHFLTPFIKNPFEEGRKSKRAAESFRDLQKSIQKQNALFEESCWKSLQSRFDPNLLAKTPTSTLIEYAKQNVEVCKELPKTPLALVREFNSTHEAWRSYWFQKSGQRLSNWQREMLALQSNEMDARKIYGELVNYVRKSSSYKLVEIEAILKKYDLERYDESYPSVYKYIRFRNRGEFFLNSMVCGPLHPKNSLTKMIGFPMMFVPPALVTAEAQAACGRLPERQTKVEAASLWNDWKDGFRIINGKAYGDQFSILVQHLRAEFKDDQSVEAYWQSYVRPVVEGRVKALLAEYSQIQEEIKKDMLNPEMKKMDGLNLPFGILGHMEWQIQQYLGWLNTTLGIKFNEKETKLLQAFLDATKDESRLENLLQELKSAGFEELVALNLGDIKEENIKRYVSLSIAAEILSERLQEKLKDQMPKYSGYQLEMGQSLFEALMGLLKSLPDTQIYQVAISI